MNGEHADLTPIQRLTLAFGEFLDSAKREHTSRVFSVLLSIVAARVAHESACRLDDEARP